MKTLYLMLILLLINTIAFSQTTIFPTGSSWKYLDNGTNQGTAWRASGFDDSGWASGTAPLGYVMTGVVTTVGYGPSSTSKYITTYFRKTVNVTQAQIDLGDSLLLTLGIDDGAVIYVNGTEVMRKNLATGTVTNTTLANVTVSSTPSSFTGKFSKNLLVVGNNTIAVEVHQAAASSSDIYMDLSLKVFIPSVSRGPYMQKATSTSMLFRWSTDAPVTSKVAYGTDSTNLSQSVVISGTRTNHSVQLTGLTPNTKYYYSVGTTTQVFKAGSNYYFLTAPVSGTEGKYTFWVNGDCGNNSTNQKNVVAKFVEYMNGKPTNLALFSGDNAYTSGTDAEFKTNFFDVYQDNFMRNIPIYSAPGNHDYANGSAARQNDHAVPYYDIFDCPTNGEAGGVPSNTEAFYSYDYGNIHFLSLDSYGKENNSTRIYDTLGAQVQWIKADLAANTKPWVIAYWHHPPYTMGSHNSDTEAELVNIRQNFIKILERYGVDLIITGHSHDYERSKLMKGHYGMEATFNAATHNLSQSSGKYDGTANSCMYLKDSLHTMGGTVYVVSGSAGQLGGTQAAFPHNAMHFSDATNGGSMVLEIEANRLDAKWICADGVIRDNFTMVKNSSKVKNLTVNLGDSITLEASWVGSYNWTNNSGTTRSIKIAPQTSGTYVATDQYLCIADTFKINVIVPTVTLSALNTSAFCAGAQISVPFTTSGTFSASNEFTLQLSNALGSFANPVNIGSLTAIASGTITGTIPANATNGSNYYVRIIASVPSVTSSNTSVALTINETLPAVELTSSDADNSICASEQVTFTASGASTYEFFVNGQSQGSSSATATLTTSALIDGQNVTVTGYNACGNTTSSAITTTVISLPTASITANPGNTICAGTSVIFTATAANAGATLSYEWKLNGNSVGTNDTYTNNTLADNDVLVCKVTTNSACPNSAVINSNTINMHVNGVPAPVITGTLTFCSGSFTTLDAGSGYNSYTWSTGETTQTIAPATPGSYSVTVSNGNCSASAAPVVVTVVSAAAQPSAFTASSTTVNKGQIGVVYTVLNDPFVTYNWTYTVGTGATINGSGNSVTVDFNSIATNGTLNVTATNNCGISTARSINIAVLATDFTAGNLVVLQTTGTTSKASNAVTLKEFTTDGTAGFSTTLPSTGSTPIQSAGVYGGSEGFLTTSTDGKYLVVVGYGTSSSFSDITATASASVPRVVGKVTPSGQYQQIASSTTAFNLNDIRSAVSDGVNYWLGGASVNNVDGINYISPGTPAALGTSSTPPKAYALRIFNGQIYYSTQKSGPSNSSSQLGIFAIGTGLPISGTVVPTQIINTGSVIPEDFSFNSTTTVCYIAVNLNTSAGGIQKWTKSGSTWTLQYTLGTGASNVGAYGLQVDYSGANPVIYATTFESAGNRVIKITDTGAASTAVTIVPAVAGVFNKGISFAPSDAGIPTVNLTVSTSTASETAATAVTVTATASATVLSNQTVVVGVSGTGITAGDYMFSNTTITIPAGSSSGSVTFTVVDDLDSEGTEVATLTISTPSVGVLLGGTLSRAITIADNDNTAPTIAINVASTSNFIDGGVLTSPVSPYTISGSKGDVTDPLATLGIDFIINDLETVASNLVVTVASSNTTVVPNGNLALTGSSTIRNLKITPNSVGYSTITIQVSDGINNASYVINYAASDSIPKIVLNNTKWYTGMSDASDAIALDNDYFMTADDEVDLINVYSRHNSGLPVASFNYASYLNLPDQAKPEVDAEASAKSYKIPNRYYWIGSMSNGKDPFDNKPNRDRLFATTVTGTGATTSISVNGYAAIRSALLTWGDAHGYNFTASAAAGVDSKTVSGFAAEGMVFGPDSTTLWIGLRAPLVPTVNRTKAVIAPILNFEEWFNNGSQIGNPTFGTPIELNLGGKGIRDIIRLANGTYIIVAGDAGGNLGLSSIYKWTGNSLDTPILVSTRGNGKLNMEGVMEVYSNDSLSMNQLQVISDGGSDVIYNDGLEAKDYGNLNLRKFRSDVVNNFDLCMPLAPSIILSSQGTETSCPNFPILISAQSVPYEAKILWNTGALTKTIGISSFGAYSCLTIDEYGCKYTTYSKTVSNSLSGDFNNNGTNNVDDFLLFIPLYNTTCNGCVQDINKDNIINVNDFILFGPEFNSVCH